MIPEAREELIFPVDSLLYFSSASGKYSESIKMYQEINPLSNFYHITGLALAFLMLGNLQQSYQG